MGAGRPTVVTPLILKKLEEAFAIGCSDTEAVVYADISSTALYEYQLKNPKFAERKRELKEKPVLKARSTVVKNLDNPDLALKFLERKRKNEFGLKSDVNLTNDGGKFDQPIIKINFI